MRMWKTLALMGVSAGLGAVVALVLHGAFPHMAGQGGAQIREGGGVYTNPLLECDVAAGTIDAPKARFERQLKTEVDQILSEGRAKEVAVYYRDLNNGPAFGINQSEEFFPASLLKVPLMMAFLKRAENNKEFLDRKIDYKKSEDPSMATQIIAPEKSLKDGESYSIQTLIEYMIWYSDNSALGALFPLIPQKEYSDLFKRLGINNVDLNNAETKLSVVEYSTFFRVLFNASYLNVEESEKALELLTKSVFANGLRAGVPDSIKVAHKFGERDFGDGYYQLHDCGIVYVPNKPYLLCVMTRGTNQKEIEKVIADISELSYREVTKH